MSSMGKPPKGPGHFAVPPDKLDAFAGFYRASKPKFLFLLRLAPESLVPGAWTRNDSLEDPHESKAGSAMDRGLMA
jgi:hypothetical protein